MRAIFGQIQCPFGSLRLSDCVKKPKEVAESCRRVPFSIHLPIHRSGYCRLFLLFDVAQFPYLFNLSR